MASKTDVNIPPSEEATNAQKTSVSVPFQVACGLMALFFAYTTYVQMNDPDWYLWGPLYGSAMLISLSQLAPSMRSGGQLLAGMLFCLSAGLLVISVASESNGKLKGIGLSLTVDSEVGREQLGALILSGWTAFLAFSPLSGVITVAGGQSEALAALGSGVLLLLPALLLAATWAVPKLAMDADRLKLDPHCHGLGFVPDEL